MLGPRAAGTGAALSGLGKPLGPGAGLALACGAHTAAAAADTVFTVGNYPVEARAENAVAAKSRALADGQQAAFRSLLKRLVPVTSYQRLQPLRQVPAGDLVEGVSVRSERNSTTDYIASLDFSFQSKAVRDLLRREGIPFMDEQAPTLTLVPLWRSPASAAPKEDSGVDQRVERPRSGACAHAREAAGPEEGDHARRPSMRWPKATAAPSARWSRPTAASSCSWPWPSRISRPSGSTSRSRGATPSAPSCSSAPTASTRPIPATPASWRPWSRSASSRAAGRPSSLPVAAAATARRRQRHTAGDSDLLIAVEFRGMSEWQDISRKLSATPGVEELEVAGLSARGARVTLRYAEGAERLADALAQQGLSLRNAGGNWVLGLQ